MGQKVNPHGLRVGIIKDWDSRWFADKKSFGDSLVEDYNLRVFLKNLRTKFVFLSTQVSPVSLSVRAEAR